MSLELIKSIEGAEQKAEAIRQDAQREAREIIKAVEEACVANERAAAGDQRAMVQRVLEEAKQTSQKQMDEMAKSEAAARQAVIEAARARLDAVSGMIFERVVSDGHR